MIPALKGRHKRLAGKILGPFRAKECSYPDFPGRCPGLFEPEDFAGLVTPERLEEVKELEARSGDRDGYGLARFK
jgi:hypothetical protein